MHPLFRTSACHAGRPDTTYGTAKRLLQRHLVEEQYFARVGQNKNGVHTHVHDCTTNHSMTLHSRFRAGLSRKWRLMHLAYPVFVNIDL